MPPPNANLSTANLPILQKASDAYKMWHNLLPHLPRLTKHSLGEKISLLFTDIIELILTAGFAARDNKLLITQKASIKLDTLKFFLQIAWELKILDNKKYISVSTPLIEVGKMLGGWQKQLNQEKSPRLTLGIPEESS
jgi:hypothetical protein